MRIYRNCKHAASETKRELAEMGVDVQVETMQDKYVADNPEYLTKELIAYSYAIRDTSDKDELLKAFGKEKGIAWAEAEFAERIGQQKLNPGGAYKIRDDVWNEFIHEGKFSYTYSERLGDQIEKVINTLKENRTCRNGIMAMWDLNIDIDRIGGKQRVPCTMYYQPLIRNGRLNMIYNIRSNDLYEHWAYDVWLAIRLQEYIAEQVGVEVGTFYQFIGSLHSYAYKSKGVF